MSEQLDSIARSAYTTRKQELWGNIKRDLAEFAEKTYADQEDLNITLAKVKEAALEYNEIMNRCNFRGPRIQL